MSSAGLASDWSMSSAFGSPHRHHELLAAGNITSPAGTSAEPFILGHGLMQV